MSLLKHIALASVLAAVLTACTTTGAKPSETRFKPLFDGKTLKGWKLVGPGDTNSYFVSGGAIVASENVRGHLLTEKEYADFILRFEFKVAPSANNGIAIRVPGDWDKLSYVGNEIQIVDDYSDAAKGYKPWQMCGSLYGVVPAKFGAQKPAGEWNDMEITVRGRVFQVVLNGKTILDTDVNRIVDPEILQKHPGLFREKGCIGFLGHRSRVEYRNLRICELPRFYEHKNSPPAGFQALFNGRDLTGWRGLVENPEKRAQMSLDEWAARQIQADRTMRQNWRVEKGELVYRGQGFDNLCTAREFGNFELLADWKVEPKSDSGIYLRGCPQVQIWERGSNGFDPLHPGSGGLYNNQKGPNYPAAFADRYPGEWNRFRILMLEDKVHVFLNGQLVVDNAVFENFWNREKTVYPLGPIELQAHATPVRFRNLYIREIPRIPKAEPVP